MMRSNYIKPDPKAVAAYKRLQADRARARNHFPHDYASDGRCILPGCDVYDLTEDARVIEQVL